MLLLLESCIDRRRVALRAEIDMQISEALHTKCDGEFLGRKEST